MPDSAHNDHPYPRSEDAPIRSGSFRGGYVLSVVAASVVLFLAGWIWGYQPSGLPTVGALAASFGVAAVFTALAFAVRVHSRALQIIRYCGWGLVLAVGVVLMYGMTVSEPFAMSVLAPGVNAAIQWGSLTEQQAAELAVNLLISRTAAVIAAACLGMIAAFAWGTLLDLKKYHTFLCIRLMRMRVTNYLVTLAIAGSVAVLIVVLSVMSGFDYNLQDRIRGTLATVSIEAKSDAARDRVRDYETLIDWLKEEPRLKGQITACAPYVQCFVFLKTPEYTTQAFVRGIDMQREKQVGDIEKYLKDGKDSADFLLKGSQPENPGILLGQELAKTLNLAVEGEDGKPNVRRGTEITLDPPMVGVLRGNKFSLVGTFKTGYIEYDSRFVYIPLADAQIIAGYGSNEVSGISIALKNPNSADKVKKILEELVQGEYKVKTWADQRPELLAAVHLERIVMSIVLGSLILLAGLFVCAVMLMAVKEKTRDIGIIKAIGGTVSGIMEIFIINGLVIGVLGAFIGGTGGLLFVRYINEIATFVEKYMHLRVFPKDIYYLDSIPTHVNPVGLAMILTSAIAVSLLAALVPSMLAAKLKPVEALRYE